MEDKRERWEWSIGRNGYKHLMSGDDYILSPESDLGDYGLSCIEWCDVSDEHARVIAAAPCLLEALKALVSPWEEMLDVELYENMKQHEAFRIVEARAAIARATQP